MNGQPVNPLPAPDVLATLTLENAQLKRELTQARAELEAFTASVSHDLRASLRHVNAYVQIIEEDLGGQAPSGLIGHLRTVSQAARQMGRQIDGLTALSRLNQVALQLSPVALAPLVRDVWDALAPELKGRTIDWQVAQDCPALLGDAALLHQVFMHLFSNAIKFSASRAVAEIKVTWQREADGRCALTVTDNGVGFNPAYTDRLFHAFQRLHGAREFEGLGMGLALTRKIIERHGGTVRASGAVDAGCRITVTLPVQ